MTFQKKPGGPLSVRQPWCCGVPSRMVRGGTGVPGVVGYGVMVVGVGNGYRVMAVIGPIWPYLALFSLI